MKFVIARDVMNPWARNFAVRIGTRLNESQPFAIAKPLQFYQPNEHEGYEVDPAFMASRDDLQALMDELWHVGIRPSEGSGSAGSLAAAERHLADMRALVFKQNPTP